MQHILKSYLKKLTNLTGQNKSLLMLKLSASDLDLHELDFANKKPSFDLIDQLIAGKSEILLCDISDSRNEKLNLVSTRLKKILRQETLVFEERGAKDLYVGYPFIRGKLLDGTHVRCPLLFFPVTLQNDGFSWKLEYRKDQNISLNKSLLLAYIHYNKIALSDELLEEDFDDFGKDSVSFRTALYELIKESPLSIHFNQDVMMDKLTSFKEFTKEDFEDQHFNGELKLYPEAILGLFPQAGSYLVPDYESLIEKDEFKTVENFFDVRNGDADNEESITSIQKIREEQTFTPFKLDGSQENAIKAVKSGKSVVVQGPPGTGKSQFICNLICDFIARRKRVLLVSQKRAALDVVYDRLKQKGIHDFLCLVHDFRNDRKDIYAKIEAQIDRVDEYKLENSSLDALALERKFLQISRRIDQLIEELENYKNALFDEKEFGLSVKQLYLTCDPDKEFIDLKEEYKSFKREELASFQSTLKAYFQYQQFRDEAYVWKDRKSFAGLTNADQREIRRLIDHIPSYSLELFQKLKVFTNSSISFSQCEELADIKNEIESFLSLLKDEDVFESLKFCVDKKTDKKWLDQKQNQLEECFNGSGIEKSLASSALKNFKLAFDKAYDSRKSFLKWIVWSLFSKEKQEVKKVFQANNLAMDLPGFDILSLKLEKRIQFENIVAELKQCEWIKSVPETLNPEIFKGWFENYGQALESKNSYKKLSLKKYLDIIHSDQDKFIYNWYGILNLVKEIPFEKRSWMVYFTSAQIDKLISDKKYAELLQTTLKKDFDFLKEMDEMEEKLSSVEKSVLDKLLNHEQHDASQAMLLFENSLKLEWIDHIEEKYSVLKGAGTFKLEQLEAELINQVEEKFRICKDILILRTRERTYNSVQYNRLSNRVTYRDLKHQVTKKKKVWPLRRLVQEFHEELFDLLPCWMASPESVSSIFPLETLFDIVIFDEASQCYAERGIPAMYRGKQIVIAGDEKQLKPSDLYQIRFEDEVEEHPDAEVESLLHLGQNYLMQVYLQGHYRSRSSELIEFSNNHFYKGRLKMIPDHKDLNRKEPAISFIKLNGLWEKRTNRDEAEYVVELVKKLLQENKSIGVVTFNYTQASLIQDLLDEQLVKGNLTLPENFFVKNIENVQGDERDIIIFSVGYARDPKGKLSMQFGSLNMDGGSNRLNVAVTRAKEKIYLISSILPGEMDVSEVKHEGPKLLKAYLQYAYNVSEGIKIQASQEMVKSKDWYLSSKIKDMQIEADIKKTISQDLAFSDLVVSENKKYSSLILTDDNLYYQAVSVKEFHAYHPMTLKEKNWNFLKINSRHYWSDKKQLKDNLLKYIGHV